VDGAESVVYNSSSDLKLRQIANCRAYKNSCQIASYSVYRFAYKM